jgi:hypothetical protein
MFFFPETNHTQTLPQQYHHQRALIKRNVQKFVFSPKVQQE